MTSATVTPVTCPNCHRSFGAQVQEIFDAGQDPNARSQFLRYRPPVARCPHCGYNGALATPLLYHDPDKELLLVYVPLELGLRQADQERLIGSLTNRVIQALPPEKRKGYLLQPKLTLSYQGIVDQVLAAEGITPEMVQKQRQRVELLDRLARAAPEELPALVEGRDADLDAEFFQMLSASIDAAAADGQAPAAQQLAALRERLLPLTSVGQRAQRQAAAIEELEQAAGEQGVTVELLLERLAAAQDDAIVEALVAAARPLIDYNFFMALAERIGQAEGRGDKAEAERLKQLREKILALSAEIDRRNRAMLDRAAQTLRAIAQSPDIAAAVREHADEIDDAFMAVLDANLQAAQQNNQPQTLQRLQQVGDAVMQLVQAAAPPEIQLVNQLLALEAPEAVDAFLREHRHELTPELLAMMSDIADNLRENKREDVAERLDQLRGKIGNLIAYS